MIIKSFGDYRMINNGKIVILSPDREISDYDDYGNLLTGTVREVEEMQRNSRLKRIQEELANIALLEKVLESGESENVAKRKLEMK